MSEPEQPREPRMMCARRYLINDDPDDAVYCGLHMSHSGFHVAMLWFEDNDCTLGRPQTAGRPASRSQRDAQAAQP